MCKNPSFQLVLIVAVSMISGAIGASWVKLPEVLAVGSDVPVADIVQAREFRLIGDNGAVRALLDTEEGQARIRMADRNSATRLCFSVMDDGETAVVAGRPDEPAAYLLVAPKKVATLAVRDGNSNGRATISVSARQTPVIELVDAIKGAVWSSPTTPVSRTREPQTYAPQTPQIPAGKAAWRRLQVGMSQDEVRSLLGEPGKVDVSPFDHKWVYWYYPDILGGEVRFEHGLVNSWSEP